MKTPNGLGCVSGGAVLLNIDHLAIQGYQWTNLWVPFLSMYNEFSFDYIILRHEEEIGKVQYLKVLELGY